MVVAIALVALLNIVTTAFMMRAPPELDTQAAGATEETEGAVSRLAVAAIVATFIVLQGTNNAVVAVMDLFVTKTLKLNVIWAGVALGVAAAFEVPVLLLIGRFGRRYSDLSLITSGCLAGVAYYVAMSFASGWLMLIALQVLNAWFFGVVAGVGISLFQSVIPRPGLASGLFTNTRRLGAILSGPLISLASISSLGYRVVFALSGVLTALALVVTMVLSRRQRQRVGQAANFSTTSGTG